LERDDHAIAHADARHRRTDLEHVGDELVTEREAAGDRKSVV
jgi:hypothetical protein